MSATISSHVGAEAVRGESVAGGFAGVRSGTDEELLDHLTQLRSGKPAALSLVYRAYAGRLFDYAMALLNSREAAEDAVHDSLVVALRLAGRVQRPDQLPAWLYAITRNECLRQARRRRPSPPRPQVEEYDDHTVYFGPDLLHKQARAWVRDAAAGLHPNEREALDLVLRHGMTDVDLAAVRGISVKRAAALLVTAEAALESALDVLFTSRAGHGMCADLDSLLEGWDGLFTQPVRERVSRHMRSCANCAPVTWSQGGAVELFAEVSAEPLPSLLERRVLATLVVPSRVVSRVELAEPFGRNGFPIPLDQQRRRWPAAIWAAASVAAVLVGVGVYALSPGEQLRSSSTEPGPPVGLAAPPAEEDTPLVTQEQGSEPPTSPIASPSPSPTVSGATPTTTPTATAPASSEPVPSPTPTPTATAGRQTSRGTVQVDALFADATVGCGSDWAGDATTYVRPDVAKSVTFRWGASRAMPNAVAMRNTGPQRYQAKISGLPNGRTVYWKVVAVTDAGETITTGESTIEHGCS